MAELANRNLPINEKDGNSRTSFEVGLANGYSHVWCGVMWWYLTYSILHVGTWI